MEMDLYTACSIVEGWAGEGATEAETLAAWSYLIKSGMCWSLQGWYGRNATELIRNGVISRRGEVLI